MLTLDQVNLLANKVTQAVERIRVLTEENKALEQRLIEKTNRVKELETIVSAFKEDQSRIEEGILSALSRLNEFEDTVLQQNELPVTGTPAPAIPAQAPVTDPQDTAKPEPVAPSFNFDTVETIVPDSEPAYADMPEQELSFESESGDEPTAEIPGSMDIPEIF